MSDIQLDHEALRRHANNLYRAAQELESIRSAAAGINLGDGAFGVMCAMLPPEINLFRPVGLAVMSSSSNLLERTGDGLKAAADDHFDTDAEIASGLNRLEMRLGSLG